MSNYNNVDATKAALFGSAAGAPAPSKPRRNAGTSGNRPSSSPTVSSTSTKTSSAASNWSGKINLKSSLNPEQKVEKMNEAEDLRKRAKKLMMPGFFSSADPVAATTYYKRAADLYKSCDEPKLEMLLRLSAAELNDDRLAAAEYSRAAELAVNVEGYGVEQADHYYQCSAQIYLDSGDNDKAAIAIHKAGSIFIDQSTKSPMTGYENMCIKNLERSVDMFVPIVLNPHQVYASTLEIEENFDERTAREMVVTKANAGKVVNSIMLQLAEMGELNSALYAAGATSYLYENDGVSTVSLNRSFLSETIIMLAMGDIVAANELMMKHFQNSGYLRSRECALEEDLVRAIQSCDEEALSKCQIAPVLNNLDRILVNLVMRLRVLGVAKAVPKTSDSLNNNGGDSNDDDVFQEMDDLMGELGLDGSDDEEEFDLT